jgi:tripartite-type tricarboxylate transporter receptor subunit TctC
MGEHIPGHPTLVVQNMPGAGGLKAANYLYSAAPKNGSVIATFARGMAVEPLFSDQPFDGTKFVWLGSISKDVSTCIAWNTSPIRRWEDLLTKRYVVAGQGAGADPDVFALTLKNVFDAKVKLVSGFPGTNEMALAMERGEVDGMCGISYSTLTSRHEAWLRDKKIHILVQARLEKEPALPDVPLITDLAKDKEKIQILKLIVATQGMARPFAAPPGTPADRAAALRAAFAATMKDPEFIADAKRMAVDVSPISGGAIEALLAELYATPKAIVAKAAHAVSDN